MNWLVLGRIADDIVRFGFGHHLPPVPHDPGGSPSKPGTITVAIAALDIQLADLVVVVVVELLGL